MEMTRPGVGGGRMLMGHGHKAGLLLTIISYRDFGGDDAHKSQILRYLYSESLTMFVQNVLTIKNSVCQLIWNLFTKSTKSTGFNYTINSKTLFKSELSGE